MVGESSDIPSHLFSSLVDSDPGMRDLVAEFLDGLVNRVADLRSAHAEADWTRLLTLAHQIKGAGGSYGYPRISELATAMETAFKVQSAGEFETWIAQLEQLVRAAGVGLRSQ
jgi:HPt (histidine-containing phosphotransfer) domain-containing protein